MGFVNDLAKGHQGESLVIDLFNKHKISCYKKNKGQDYDLYVKYTDEFTVEVKYDLYASKSGNIALEYWNPKKQKPSGISVSEADVWAHILNKPTEIWLCSVNYLKYFIDVVSPLRTIDCGGDKNASLHLYRKQDILPKVFFRVDQLKTKDFMNVINSLLIINRIYMNES